MRNKIKKIILNIIMTVLFAMLMKVAFTGIALHEIIGLSLGFLFIAHNAINFKWVKAAKRNFSKINIKSKIQLISDFALIGSVALIILSGMLISQVLFTALNPVDLVFWSDLHHVSAYVALGLIAFHILLHAKEMASGFKAMYLAVKQSKGRVYAMRAASVGFAVLVVASLFGLEKSTQATDEVYYSEDVVVTPKTNAQTLPDIKTADASTYNEIPKDTQSASESVTQTPSTDTEISLEEFLSSIQCTGCGKRCLLTNLRCGRGESYKQEAIAQYNATYTANTITVNETTLYYS